MAAEEIYTWDVDTADGGARRAASADLGGSTMTDDANYPPDKSREPHADLFKQQTAQLAGLNRICPAAILEVTNSGTPSISYVAAMGTTVDASVFDVTDEGAGITLIEWTRGVLPTAYLRPKAFHDSDTAAPQPYAVRVSDVTTAGLDGVRVKTRNAAGSLADMNFTVWIF
jgi:hypothetical protein